jgi:hypothetical protein
VGVRTSSGACGALGSVQGGSVALPSSRIQARVPAGETSGSHCGERRSGWQSGNWLSDRRTGTTPRRADIFALSAMTSGHHSRVHTETIRPCSVRVLTAIPRSVTDDRIKLEPPAHTWSQSARTPSTAVVPFVRFLPGARLTSKNALPAVRKGRSCGHFAVSGGSVHKFPIHLPLSLGSDRAGSPCGAGSRCAARRPISFWSERVRRCGSRGK